MTDTEAQDILRTLTIEALERPLGRGHRKPKSITLNPDTYARLQSRVVARARATAPEGVHVKLDAGLRIGGVPCLTDTHLDVDEARIHHANGVNVTHKLPYGSNLGPERMKA